MGVENNVYCSSLFSFLTIVRILSLVCFNDLSSIPGHSQNSSGGTILLPISSAKCCSTIAVCSFVQNLKIKCNNHEYSSNGYYLNLRLLEYV